MKLFSLAFASTCLALTTAISLIPPPPGNECKSPHGDKGLGAALRELVDLIPMRKLTLIYIKAVSQDKEVMAAMEYIESNEFKNIVATMHNQKEFGDVLEYFCNELYFNAYFYLNALENVLGFPVMPKPPHNHHLVKRGLFGEIFGRRRHGFEGFLEDMYDALPHEKLRATYKKRYDTDEYLRLAVKQLSSPEFQKIGDAIQAMPEYKHMLQKLRDVHVDVDKILKKLADFFGWKVHGF